MLLTQKLQYKFYRTGIVDSG